MTKKEKTLYEYCKEISTLYELESTLSLSDIEFDDDFANKIIFQILDLEDELREKIKGGKL